jgi:hypothetical protein
VSRPIRAGAVALGLSLGAIGCAGLDVDATVVLSEVIPTVATVSWELSGDDVTAARVAFTPDDGDPLRSTARVDDDGWARAVLLGMKPLTAYTLTIEEERGGDWLGGGPLELETGGLSSSLPGLTLHDHDPARAAGGYLVTSLITRQGAGAMLDGDGDVVWAHEPDLDWEVVFISRTRYTPGDDHVTYLARDRTVLDDSNEQRKLVRVSLDGTVEEHLDAEDVHHDYLQLADGGFAVLERDYREVEGETVKSDSLVEIGPDGARTVIWSAWDHFEFDPGFEVESDGSWCHANALDLDEDAGVYRVSLRNFGTIVEIDRASGAQLRTIGGATSDYTLDDGSTELFAWQHQFEVLDDGVLVFDNGTADVRDSRAVEYGLDDGAAVPVWEFHAEPPLFTPALGDVQRLDNGNTLVSWSSSGQIDEVTPDGEVVWRLRTQMAAGFGFTRWLEALDATSDD